MDKIDGIDGIDGIRCSLSSQNHYNYRTPPRPPPGHQQEAETIEVTSIALVSATAKMAPSPDHCGKKLRQHSRQGVCVKQNECLSLPVGARIP